MRNNIFRFGFIGFILFLLLQLSCNEQPTELGMVLHTDTLVIEGISSSDYNLFADFDVFPFYTSYNELAVLVGESDDYKASAVFQIGFDQRPDTLDYLTEEDIIEVKLFLFLNKYQLGDTSKPTFAFDINKIGRFWSPRIIGNEERDLTFTTWDSLFVSPANYFETSVGNYSGTPNVNDSASSILSIDIAKSYALDLFKVQKFDNNNDGEIDSVVNVIDWGFALVPTSESRVINQLNFYAIGTDVINLSGLRSPYLQIIYNSKEGEIDTLKMYTETAAQFGKSPEIPDNRFVIQAGNFLRTSIGFDISVIPPLAGIVKADLQLFADLENSKFGNSGIDTVITIATMLDSLSWDVYNSLPFTGYYNDSTKSYYFPSLSSAIELWMRTDAYPSLILTSNLFDNSTVIEKNENYQFDRVSFFGPNVDNAALKPKLRIIYSHVPDKK